MAGVPGSTVTRHGVSECGGSGSEPWGWRNAQALHPHLQVSLNCGVGNQRTRDASGIQDLPDCISYRLLYSGVDYVSGVAHALGKVTWCNVEGVDAVYRGDFFDVADGDDVFDERHGENILVGLAMKVIDAESTSSAELASDAVRAEAYGGCEILSLFASIDVRDHDAAGAAIERSSDPRWAIAMNADH